MGRAVEVNMDCGFPLGPNLNVEEVGFGLGFEAGRCLMKVPREEGEFTVDILLRQSSILARYGPSQKLTSWLFNTNTICTFQRP